MKYPYTLDHVKDEGTALWIAESILLKDCCGLGPNPSAAIQELEKRERALLGPQSGE